jgi:pimeloyl-ACP methyl ester carboxylesterase
VPVDRLATGTAPALVLAGGISPHWDRDTAAEVAAAIPGARWQVLEGQGHGAADEHLIPMLEEFLAPLVGG